MAAVAHYRLCRQSSNRRHFTRQQRPLVARSFLQQRLKDRAIRTSLPHVDQPQPQITGGSPMEEIGPVVSAVHRPPPFVVSNHVHLAVDRDEDGVMCWDKVRPGTMTTNFLDAIRISSRAGVEIPSALSVSLFNHWKKRKMTRRIPLSSRLRDAVGISSKAGAAISPFSATGAARIWVMPSSATAAASLTSARRRSDVLNLRG
jgi:hypothetical protein